MESPLAPAPAPAAVQPAVQISPLAIVPVVAAPELLAPDVDQTLWHKGLDADAQRKLGWYRPKDHKRRASGNPTTSSVVNTRPHFAFAAGVGGVSWHSHCLMITEVHPLYQADRQGPTHVCVGCVKGGSFCGQPFKLLAGKFCNRPADPWSKHGEAFKGSPVTLHNESVHGETRNLLLMAGLTCFTISAWMRGDALRGA